MIFSSVLFLFRFLPVFIICYFAVPQRMMRLKNIILFLGSLIFYAWGEPVYVVLMLFSTLSDFIHGQRIEACRAKGGSGKGWLISSLLINLLLLGFFKYADFLIGVCNTLTGSRIPQLNLPLPIGISFYTFQTMSYSVDVYRGEVKAQKNLLNFGVFVTMFPQLIAGPIVRYKTAEEFLGVRKSSAEDIAYGIRRFVLGLGKKVLFANNVGMIWTQIAGMDFDRMTAGMAWLGILAYAFQIYFDFSGYSDMAIGLGAIMGFRFPENFNYPYISRSITEFWRRWHISLGTWFKEYVYIPLGGNRKGIARQIVNILIVWALTGIWHGAGWNFLLWGLWFALFLILEKAFLGKWLKRLPAVVCWLYSMLAVLIGWVLFALESDPSHPGGQIIPYLGAMLGINGVGLADRETMYLLTTNLPLFVLLILGAVPVWRNLLRILRERAESTGEDRAESGRVSLWFVLGENIALAVIFILSVGYIVEASFNPFLYFRF
ncbi:MAG: MBOAT family protein [Lachnospiraceae bacterium]|nr:MBOAT family protein [Lachnospiraceae bacterium]